jgi:hypothetical protein
VSALPHRPDLFERWLGGRAVFSMGTNSGAHPLAFQAWHRFKEAFTPELVKRTIDESPVPVRTCIDPFGGSGTTALTAQFLGIHSTTVEVNPFLADVARAKVARYDTRALMQAIVAIRRQVRSHRRRPAALDTLPPTFIEPGVNGRWIFDAPVAQQINAILTAVARLNDETLERFFRVILGGLLIDVSNVVVSGKGRRYRRGWTDRTVTPAEVDTLFFGRVESALADVHQFAARSNVRADVLNNDARKVRLRRTFDLLVCSPPYPNSFDYTDVYNVELWMLGYLKNQTDNRDLRHATLSSHVQLQRVYAPPPTGSPLLQEVLTRLSAARADLWSPWLPAMVGAYFADLLAVVSRCAQRLVSGATAWFVVGDSRYARVEVPVAAILSELAATRGWEVWLLEPFRAMKSSAQQGRMQIAETLLVIRFP